MNEKLVEYFRFRNLKSGWKSLLVLVGGISLTLILAYFASRSNEQVAMKELASISMEIDLKIDARLHAHAIILRAGAAYFSVTDTVTRDDWSVFVDRSRLDVNLPGILGMGYSVIIPPDELQDHINKIREEGFPEYTVRPEGDRDIYTSIVYLEPFTGRNLRAFGYDMFSEPVRRKAMEIARDNNVAMLTGKVDLVQETDEDVQAGTLMYVPYYEPSLPANTVEERRAAIRGWVYNPYRMRDLMQGILGRWDEVQEDRVRLQVYDDSLHVSSLLYDSQFGMGEKPPSAYRSITMPVEFNGKNWLLVFTQEREFPLFHINVLTILFSGIIISGLLYLLSESYFKISTRSKQIRIQNKELQKLNATKDKFFSIIAHDLKSPFNSIMGFSKLLVDQVRQKQYDGVAKFADIIYQSSNVAVELLMNLMEWSQSQTGRMVFNPEEVELNELVGEIELVFKDAASHKSIDIHNKVPAGTIVFADYDMLGTIMRNLISNAIKFSYPGGIITIRVSKTGKHHKISISDTGVGIPEKHIARLFRIDESYSTKGTQNEKGTGLGLILCKEFVEKHGGKIWVETIDKSSDANSTTGTTFYFTFPIANIKVNGKKSEKR